MDDCTLIEQAPTGLIQKDMLIRAAIVQLEATMRQYVTDHALAEVDCPLVHTFAPGAYARTILIPVRTLLVGKIHKVSHIAALLSGSIDAATEDGLVRHDAPCVFVTPAGTKRVIYARTDAVLTTFHVTPYTDLDAIEQEIIAPTYDILDDVLDYRRMLSECDVPEEQVRAISENPGDQIPMPDGPYKFLVKPSPIQGLGVFTLTAIPSGERLGPARVGRYRTPLGRYLNHGLHPNGIMRYLENGDINLVALRDLSQDEEITVDYRHCRAIANQGVLL